MGNGAVFPRSRRFGTPSGSSTTPEATYQIAIGDYIQPNAVPTADGPRNANNGVSENGYADDSHLERRHGEVRTSREFKSSGAATTSNSSASPGARNHHVDYSSTSSSSVSVSVSGAGHDSANAAEASEQPTCRFCLEPGRVHGPKRRIAANLSYSGARRPAVSAAEETIAGANGDQKGADKEDEDDEGADRFEIDDDDDEVEDPNVLVSPCQCRGTAEYVHLGCLRTWQDKVSVASQRQPFRRSPLAGRRRRDNGNVGSGNGDDDNDGGGQENDASSDSRHSVCQSCQTPFTVRPLRPLQILFRDGGPQLVECNRILGPGCLLVATKRMNNVLPPSLISALGARGNIFPVALAALLSLRHAHWRRSVYLVVAVHPSSSSSSSSSPARTSDRNIRNTDTHYHDRRSSNHPDWHRSLAGDADDEIFAINLTRPVSAGASAFAASMTASEQREREQRDREQREQRADDSSTASSSPSASSSLLLSPSPSVSSEAFAAAMAAGAAAAEAARTNSSGGSNGNSSDSSSAGGGGGSSTTGGVHFLPHHGGPVQAKDWRIAAAVVPASTAGVAASSVALADGGSQDSSSGAEGAHRHEETSPSEMSPPPSDTGLPSPPDSARAPFEDVARIPLAVFPTHATPPPPPLSSSSSLELSPQQQRSSQSQLHLHALDESKAADSSPRNKDAEGKDTEDLRSTEHLSSADAAADAIHLPFTSGRAVAVGSLDDVLELLNSASASGDNSIASLTVHTFSGYAKWTRAQLLAEVARGSWGLLPSHPEPANGPAAADDGATAVDDGATGSHSGNYSRTRSSSSHDSHNRREFGGVECVARYLKDENFAELVESSTREGADTGGALSTPPHNSDRSADAAATAHSIESSIWATLESISLTCPAAERMISRELATSE